MLYVRLFCLYEVLSFFLGGWGFECGWSQEINIKKDSMALVSPARVLASHSSSSVRVPNIQQVKKYSNKSMLAFFCPVGTFSKRWARSSCWLSWTLSEHKQVCVSEKVWFLEMRKKMPLCGVFEGRWKQVFFLKNDSLSLGMRWKSPLWVWSIQKSMRSVKQSVRKKKLKKQYVFPHGVVLFWRNIVFQIEIFRQQLSSVLRPWDSVGLLRKLLLAERVRGQNGLRRLGFVHVFTTAGIHLYALFRILFFILKYVFFFLKVPPAWGRKGALLSAFFLFLGAWMLQGMRLGMLRPWLLVWIRVSGRGLGVSFRFWAPLCFALFGDFFWEEILKYVFSVPVFQTGRIHYALAVGGGLLALQLWEAKRKQKEKHLSDTCTSFEKKKQKLKQGNFWFRFQTECGSHVALSVGSWFCTAVWDLFLEHQMAVGTPVLSLITIPLLTLALYPAALGFGCAMVFGDGAFWKCVLENVAFLGNHLFLYCLSWVLSGPFFWIISFSSAVLGAVLALGLMGWRKEVRYGVCVLLCVLRGFGWKGVWNHQNWFWQLDIGQGQSTMISTEDGTLGLIDTGSARFFSWEKWLQVFLKVEKNALDWVVLTHFNEDHRGGVDILLRLLPIRCLGLTPSLWRSREGQFFQKKWKALGLHVVMLPHPCFPHRFWELVSKKNQKSNQYMSAFGILFPHRGSYLTLGDADHVQEKIFLKKVRSEGNFLNPHLRNRHPFFFLLSHHGSSHSSSKSFLKSLRPDFALLSSHARNPFGHPGAQVLHSLRTLQIPLWRTDLQGGFFWSFSSFSFLWYRNHYGFFKKSSKIGNGF